MLLIRNGPVGAEEFETLMKPLGPFEKHPHIAIACSGGRDSMALALLIHDWATARGGAATALIVDHALRAESASEAKLVAKRLRLHEIATVILRRRGPEITGGVQAAARGARYALMSDWCETNAYLHLAIGHHLEDQAETFLLRLARGSGVDGLAAMASVTETRTMRVLRPLLPIPGARLGETLKRYNFARHVEDPSNRDRAFARVRMRDLSSLLAGEGMTAQRLSATAARMARAREALETAVAALLARAAVLHAAGYCILDTAMLRAAPAEIALRALARVLTCVSGHDYPPRLARLQRIHAWLRAGDGSAGRTLSGCRILMRKESLLICREPAAADAILPTKGTVYWDNRFRIRFAADGRGEVRRLGSAGWRQLIDVSPALKSTPIPAPARPGLPAIWLRDELLAVPHFGYRRHSAVSIENIAFSPKRSLVTARFTLH